MPSYAVDLLAEELSDGLARAQVLILGVSYRGGVKESAFSGAFALADELRLRGARALAADPLYSDAELSALGFEPWGGGEVDAAIVQADHSTYAATEAGGRARRARADRRPWHRRSGAVAGGRRDRAADRLKLMLERSAAG